jgi:hypothetical protein
MRVVVIINKHTAHKQATKLNNCSTSSLFTLSGLFAYQVFDCQISCLHKLGFQGTNRLQFQITVYIISYVFFSPYVI